MSDRHEEFAGKNAAMSRAWGASKPKVRKKKNEPKTGICEKCQQEKMVRSYRVRLNDRSEGVASYGFTSRVLCEECRFQGTPRKKEEALSDKAIKSMLRNAKRSLR